MRAWPGVVLLGSLVVGCGGPLPEEAFEEAPAVEEALEESDTGAGEVSAEWKRPVPEAARRVKTLFPASDRPAWMADGPESLVAFRGKLYFAVNRGSGQETKELWVSDGTAAGTVALKSFPPYVIPFGFWDSLDQLTVVGHRLFFVVGDTSHGRELWTTDGTAAGTRRVKDISPGAEDSFLEGLVAVGDRLLFFRYLRGTETAPEHSELWRSDGTEAGTVRVRDFGPGVSLSTVRARLGRTLFFSVTDAAHGTELWRTDGTAAGTGLLKDIHPGPGSSYPFQLRVVDGRLFFTAEEPAHGEELWKSDGTEAGTVLAEDFRPGPASGFPRLLEAVGSRLYVTLLDEAANTLDLYRVKADGSKPPKRLVTLPNPYASEPEAVPFITTSAVTDGKLYFGMGISTPGPAPRDVQLWVTDGSRSGTRLLTRPLSLSDEFQSSLFALDDTLLFSGFAGSKGLELWGSDGTVEGTRRLRDIAPGAASSYPTGFTRVGDSVFFVARDETGGNQLWLLPLRRPGS